MHGDLSSPAETTGEIRTAPQRSQNPTAVWQAPSLQAFKGRERLPTLIFSASPIMGKKSDGKSSIEAKDHKERFRRALASINQWLRQERNARKLPEIWQAIGQSCVVSTTLGSPTTVIPL